MNMAEVNQMFAAMENERKNALNDAISAVKNLIVPSEYFDDKIYNSAIKDAIHTLEVLNH